VDDLQDMAGKYADTVEENRKLYNEVQDLKGNIRVFCRIRPPGTTGDQNPSCLDTGVDGEVGPSSTKHISHVTVGCVATDTYIVGCVATVTYIVGCVATDTYIVGCVATGIYLSHNTQLTSNY